MQLNVETLRRVSPLLDECLDLEEPARAAWLQDVQRRQPDMASLLHALLAQRALRSTANILERRHALLPDAAVHMDTDDDLTSLRGDAGLQALVQHAKGRHSKTS